MESENNQYLSTFMDSLIAGIVIIDQETHEIIDVNATAAEMIGLAKEDIIGNLCHKYIRTTEIGKYPVSNPEQIIDQSEHVLLNCKGESIPIQKAVKKIEKDGHVYFIESFVDISNLKKAEKELLVKEKTIDSSINALALADSEGNLTYVNTSFLELWGYDDEKEVLGQNGAKFWHYEIDPVELKNTLISRGIWSGEVIARKKDGTEFAVYLSSHITLDDTGNPTFLMASFVDITDIKKANLFLTRKLEIERTVASISSMFISSKDIDFSINFALENICELCGGSRSYIFLFNDDGNTADNTHEYCLEGVTPQKDKLQDHPVDMLPW